MFRCGAVVARNFARCEPRRSGSARLPPPATGTPVGGRRRHTLQRLRDSLFHLGVRDPARRAGARIVRQPLHPLQPVTFSPLPNGGPGDHPTAARSPDCSDLRRHEERSSTESPLAGRSSAGAPTASVSLCQPAPPSKVVSVVQFASSPPDYPRPRIGDVHYFCNEFLTQDTSLSRTTGNLCDFQNMII